MIRIFVYNLQFTCIISHIWCSYSWRYGYSKFKVCFVLCTVLMYQQTTDQRHLSILFIAFLTLFHLLVSLLRIFSDIYIKADKSLSYTTDMVDTEWSSSSLSSGGEAAATTAVLKLCCGFWACYRMSILLNWLNTLRLLPMGVSEGYNLHYCHTITCSTSGVNYCRICKITADKEMSPCNVGHG